MTIQIDTALVTQFSAQVDVAVQQQQARLKPFVAMQKVTGRDATYEGMGSIEMVEIMSRHQKTVGQDVASTRRRIRMREFRATVYLDKFDELATIIGPNSQYAKVLGYSAMRKFDALVVEAALASVYTGRDMTTVVTAASDGVVTVDATSGLTSDKTSEIQENFINNEVTTDDESVPVLFLGTGDEHTQLKGEVQFTSSDYTDAKPFVDGRLRKADGMNCVWYGHRTNASNILSVSGSTRACIAMTGGGSQFAVEVGMLQDVGIQVDPRPDLNNLTQVQASLFMGATRTQGARVQRVNTTVG
ncbi:hypothetical protein UFOVP315_49 [uncultured Caudovirales phage]|uniref:Major capsid protein n=1 Tax=uncultured Caudovirales phage TaxID=2100421 RepID=A0A6J5LVP6_9CAUD|nr:hypothetical protein UFOVP315_49 [uncultured Caudovirales phage]